MNQLNVGIVGGGLVGALEACLLAKRGFQVTLFEGRHDGRNEPSYYGRSINLAISLRGISALKRLALDYVVDELAIPMRARMIHDRQGRQKPIPYDPDGRCINSIERAALNNFLLNTAEQIYKVKILFNHKLVDMEPNKGELFFRLPNEQQLVSHKFDLILGCDGARSAVRNLLSRQMQLELEQSFIEHGYLELRIDPKPESQTGQADFKMPPNYLHIWPRGDFMMIALPNKDASFTCTLFAPFKTLRELQEAPHERGLEFFRTYFPDSLALMGEEAIEATLANVRPSALISIKCSPYHYKDKVALLGDAAHAMVPFYGQGMNCGFEDCLVLDELLDERQLFGQKIIEESSGEGGEKELSLKLESVLEKYSKIRCANGQSMSELAMHNYIEMRHLVNTWSFKARKQLDYMLYRMFPKKWIPLYTMVTFSRLPIDSCVERRRKQDELLERCARFGAQGSLLLLGSLGLIYLQRQKTFTLAFLAERLEPLASGFRQAG